MTTSATY